MILLELLKFSGFGDDALKPPLEYVLAALDQGTRR